MTAELTGRVHSAGQALPSVNVTLMSPEMQASRMTETGMNGGYRFGLLPPGDYRLRFELRGFTTLDTSVSVVLAETARLDVELSVTPVSESISVESASARLPESSRMTSIGRSLLQQLPGARDIRAAVLLSPSAMIRNGRLFIAGAPSWDSVFLVNGVVVNEYLTGQPHNLFIEDSIEEVALLTGAISAEYGRFTGGVVSALTKSGGNEFHGSLRDTATSAAWTNRTPWPDQPDSFDHKNHALEATLGGFLLRDRLWFFAAGRNAPSTLASFTDVTNIPFRSAVHDERWEAKLTDQITARDSMIASYINTLLDESNVRDTRSSGRVLDLASLIPRRWQPASLLALTYDGLLTQNTFAEAHGSRKRYALRGNGGRSTDRILGTLIVVRGVSANMNAPFGCGICGDDGRDNNSWTAKASHYSNTRFGNHTTVAGAETFHEERINSGTRSSSEFNVQTGSIAGTNAYPQFDSTTLILWTAPLPETRTTDMTTRSAYINDRWDVTGRLALNLGVRYDRNHAADAIGRLISDDSGFSPRLSATYDVTTDGRHRIQGAYGRYSAKILEGGGAPQQVGTFSELGWRYRGPEINGAATSELVPTKIALAQLFAWFETVGGLQNRQYLSFISDPRYSSEFHGSLQSPSVDEWSVMYAHQLQHGSVRADYIRRDWRNFYAARVDTTTGQRIDSYGNKIDVARIINDPETVRRYRAVEVQGSWRYGHMTAGGGYTWSKLRGNDEEEEGTTGSAPRNLPLRLYYPEFLGYPQRRPIGYLKQDQRHKARAWLGYESTLGRGSLSELIVQWFDSGRPYSVVGDIDPTGQLTPYAGVPANPGYMFNQVRTGPYFFSGRGALRTEPVFSTDLAVNYDVSLHPLHVFVKADVLNLFDNGAVVAASTQVLTRLRNGSESGLRAFNPFTELPVEGVHYRLSADFGRANGPASYQTPRTFQVSFGAKF